MANVTIVASNDASDLRQGDVAVSPSGTYRAAISFVSANTPSTRVFRSTTGASWSDLGGPGNPLVAVAVDDSGTVYALDSNTPASFYTYSGGAWSAATVTTISNSSWFLGLVGTTLIALSFSSGGTPAAFYSTNSGATWTSGGTAGGTTTFAAGNSFALIGNYLHIVCSNSTGTGWFYDRWDLSTHTWVGVTTAPTFPTPTGWQWPVIFSRHGSTSEVWIAQAQTATAVASFWVSTDSGANWTAHTSESLPTGMTTVAVQGFSMGSDDLIHVWGQGDGTKVTVVDRDRSGTWDSTIRTSTVSGFHMRSRYAQRQDGSHSNPYELYGALELTSGTISPRRLVWLSDVVSPGGWAVGSIKIGG